MNVYLIVFCIGHATVTVGTLVAVAVRIEHRLTRIETDVSWLKNNRNCCEKGESHVEDYTDVDKS